VTRLRMLSAVLTVGLSVLLGLAPAANADDAVPFTDVNVSGQLGFCDKDGVPVTSGSIRDVPFAFVAVSSVATPKAWAVKGGKAALFAATPTQNVNPLEWPTYQMTPSTVYSSARHPMAAAGYGEPPLEFATSGAPPRWDGLMQVRMYFSAPNQMAHLQPYPAAVIRVTGDRWTLVSGDRTPPCSAGTAVNLNQMLGAKSAEPTAPPSWAANAGGVASGTSATAVPSSSGVSPSASPVPSEPGASVAALPATPTQSRSGAVPLLGIVGALAVAAGVLGLALRSRRLARTASSLVDPQDGDLPRDPHNEGTR